MKPTVYLRSAEYPNALFALGEHGELLYAPLSSTPSGEPHPAQSVIGSFQRVHDSDMDMHEMELFDVHARLQQFADS